MKNNEYRLRVNDRVLGMRFRPARYAALFRDYFDRDCARKKPDVLLDFKIGGRNIEPEVDDSLFSSKVLKKKGFEISGGLVKGWYDPESKYGKILVHEVFTVFPAIRVFEQLLYQAFYTAKRTKPADAFLIHSCGIIHGGKGYLFVGRPESGKSTVARLSLPDIVLNDEMTSVYFSGRGVELCGTPFNGLFTEKSEGRCELKMVLLLRQGLEHKVTKVTGAEAVRALMYEIVPPIGLDEVITPGVREDMLDIAIRIQRSVPVYRLEFLPSRGFWHLIDREIIE
jgi:hypothetical protein